MSFALRIEGQMKVIRIDGMAGIVVGEVTGKLRQTDQGVG
jgi:hypothetical protein